jgi:hypothetical protein
MHLLVIVIGEDPDEQLEPFQENNFDTCREEYLEFHDQEDAFRERYRTGILDYPGAEAHDPEAYGKPFREVFPTFEDFMDAFYGPRDEKTGRYGEWFNPNAQYDWYQLGGRFTGHLVLKPGRKGLLGSPGVCTAPAGPGRADQARKGDIDFAAMSRESYASFLEAWAELERDGKTSDRHAKWRHDIPETVTTRERLVDYARQRSAHNAPTAFVMEGEWSGPWWLKDGVTEEAAARWDARFAALLASLPDDTLLTVIDCHVV